ncbi:hypothetical protein MMC12_008398, partial [Toensbergia leucococca]|nr:hypothetical protein [Toensbergia leucococca]
MSWLMCIKNYVKKFFYAGNGAGITKTTAEERSRNTRAVLTQGRTTGHVNAPTGARCRARNGGQDSDNASPPTGGSNFIEFIGYTLAAVMIITSIMLFVSVSKFPEREDDSWIFFIATLFSVWLCCYTFYVLWNYRKLDYFGFAVFVVTLTAMCTAVVCYNQVQKVGMSGIPFGATVLVLGIYMT